MDPEPLQVLWIKLAEGAGQRSEALVAALPEAQFRVLPLRGWGDVHDALGKVKADALVLGLAQVSEGDRGALDRVRATHPDLPVVLLWGAPADADGAAVALPGVHAVLTSEEWQVRTLARALRQAVDRVRSEMTWRAREEFFRLITENVSDLIAVLDRNGRRLYNSPSYRQTLGRTDGLSGSDSFAEIHPDDQPRIRQVFEETIVRGVGQRTEYRLVLPGGAVRTIESLGNVIRDAQGRPDRVVVVSRDITERREAMRQLEQALDDARTAHAQLEAAQQRLVHSERLEAVATFAAAIAHEVKNPLQTILLGVDFLRVGVPESDDGATTVLTEMENAARRADAVIRGLLEFAAYGKHDLAEHPLNSLIEETLVAIQPDLAKRSVQVQSRLDPALPPIRCDGKKIKHVLLKLLLGALQATPNGGQIGLVSRRGPLPPMPDAPSDPADGDWILVTIEDGGAGGQGAAPGSGPSGFGSQRVERAALDLLVVRKVVELFGGRVRTLSGPGGGGQTVLAFKP